jgi:hypothetical protein
VTKEVNPMEADAIITHPHGDGTSKYKPEYSDVAERLVAAGFTVKDLAYAFGVAKETIEQWKKSHEEFLVACEEGSLITKKRLVASGIKQALGYDYTSSKTVEKTDKNGQPVIETTTFVQHQTGNHNLLTFLLLNMARRDGSYDWVTPKQVIETDNKTISVRIDGKLASEAIDKLAGKLLSETPRKKIKSVVIEDEEDKLDKEVNSEIQDS